MVALQIFWKSCHEKTNPLDLILFIVTVESDVERFAQEFQVVNSHLRLLSTVQTTRKIARFSLVVC